MEVKLFEIRDWKTCIAAIAIKLGPRNDAEHWLLKDKCGYHIPNPTIHFGNAETMELTPDAYHNWGSRTMGIAHLYVIEHWDRLESGDVIDVRFLQQETKEPVTSDRLATLKV